MGLDTSHGCYHGSYGGFATMRRELAKLIGIDLDEMKGFGGKESWEGINHPLVPLLHHSDCDGELSVEESESIIKGFDLLEEKLQETQNETLIDFCGQFKAGCIKAVKKNEIIIFQ